MGTRSLVSPKVNATVEALVNNLLDSGAAIQASAKLELADNLTSGVGVKMANRIWPWQSRTLASGASQVIDLYDYAGLDFGAGAGCDQLGQALTVEAVVAIIIRNDNAAGVAGSLEVEPDVTNGWTPIGTHTVATLGALRAGGVLLKYQPDSTGFDVIDASSHRIKLTANGGDITYSVMVMGRHDDETSSSSSSPSSSSPSSSSSSSMTSSQSSSSSSSSSKSLTSSSSSSSATSSESSSSATSSASSQSSSSSSMTSSASSQSPTSSSSSSSSTSSESSSSEGA
jgi:hypothetical protein